jgi:hypothetical protein
VNSRPHGSTEPSPRRTEQRIREFHACARTCARSRYELTFRGLGFALLRPFGTRPAIAVTAVMFGLMHGFLVALPLFVAVGLALAWLRTRTGSVYPGMLMHGTFNGVALILAVSFG